MSEKMKGRVITDEWRKNISESQKGIPKPRTAEHQEKLNAALRGKKKSVETREKIRLALKEYYSDPLHRKENSDRLTIYHQNKT